MPRAQAAGRRRGKTVVSRRGQLSPPHFGQKISAAGSWMTFAMPPQRYFFGQWLIGFDEEIISCASAGNHFPRASASLKIRNRFHGSG
jgi:hypothetical protein